MQKQSKDKTNSKVDSTNYNFQAWENMFP